MHIIEITESKVEHLADTVGKMLHYGGMAMEVQPSAIAY